MTKQSRPTSILADPTQWSDKSKQSYSYYYTREYKDIPYKCWHCQAECVFTAQDQKYTFEVKKASVDQRRALCATCWSESHRINNALRECEDRWAASKSALQKDRAFLAHWLDLLVRLEAYVSYKPDTAKKGMLNKLLGNV